MRSPMKSGRAFPYQSMHEALQASSFALSPDPAEMEIVLIGAHYNRVRAHRLDPICAMRQRNPGHRAGLPRNDVQDRPVVLKLPPSAPAAVQEIVTDEAVVKRIARFGRQASVRRDRKSTRLNSSHVSISYAVFCLK